MRLAAWYGKIDKTIGNGDAAFAMHELAHFVLLYRRQPRDKRDSVRMNLRLAKLGNAHAQLHEIHTLALEHAAYNQLGWRMSLARLVTTSWGGIEDPYNTGYNGQRHGTIVVKSKTHALRLARETRVNPVLVTRLARLIAWGRSQPHKQETAS